METITCTRSNSGDQLLKTERAEVGVDRPLDGRGAGGYDKWMGSSSKTQNVLATHTHTHK